jgi:ribosomal protein S18 acetylase RimI-like enzyme
MYKLNKKDTEKASIILGKSFFNYPVFEYLLLEEGKRKKNISKLIWFLINCGIMYGDVYAPSENLEGISIWYRSVQLNIPVSGFIKADFLNPMLSLRKSTIDNFKELGSVKEKQRNEIMAGEYCFLDMIGVEPSQRNLGYAGLMIKNQLSKIDKSNLPCYLETGNMDNIGFYKQYGFNTVHQYSFNGINSYCMVRK